MADRTDSRPTLLGAGDLCVDGWPRC